MTEVRPRLQLRTVLLLTVLAMLAALVPAPAHAQSTQWSPSAACPSATVPSSGFTDATGTHGDAIDCLAWYALTAGRTATSYGNLSPVRRDQTASFIVRGLERLEPAGYDLPPQQEGAFSDVDSGPHEVNIEVLAGAEPPIVAGYPDGTYRPTLALTRAQFASITMRMLDDVADQGLIDRIPDASNQFNDTRGSVHEDNINRLANAGILLGKDANTFDPNGNVTRGQTASILTRVLGGFVNEDLIMQPRRFEGIVHDATDTAPDEIGDPIAGAFVAADGFTQVSSTSNSDGEYGFWLQQPGEYTLAVIVEDSDYAPQLRVLDLPDDEAEQDLAMYREAAEPDASTPTTSTALDVSVVAGGEFWRVGTGDFEPTDASEIRLRFPSGLVVELGDVDTDAAYFSRHADGTSDRTGPDAGTHSLYYNIGGDWRQLDVEFDNNGRLVGVNGQPYSDTP